MSYFVAAAARFAEGIRINEISRERREGLTVWVKRRAASAPPVLAAANLFFRLARTGIRAIDHAKSWQDWEVDCFHALHGGQFRAWAEGNRAVVAEAVPGVPLAHALDRGCLTPSQAAAAGRELRRAHSRHCNVFGGPWSHGDPHTGNFVFDERENRARLIDFEVMHDRRIPPGDRHADDLLVFLQDVLGRISAAQWLPVACAFLDGYGSSETIGRLRLRLVLPGGIPRLWWAVRTGSTASAEIERRLRELRDVLAHAPVARDEPVAA